MAAEKPIISETALADLDEIWLYIAKDSVRAADRVIEKIYDDIYRLAEFPSMGHVREDLTDKPLRFWSVYSYLIVYKPDTAPIEIVRVFSGYRDVESLLQSSLE
jgi:plasmid stabilization system protein ParE